MITDIHANPLSGATAEAARLYDEAVESFTLYRGDPPGLVQRALEAAPQFTMGHVLLAWLGLLPTEPKATTAAREVIVTLRGLTRTAREDSHLAALEALAAGEWNAAARLLELHNSLYPHDLLALHAGHLLDFYRADARSLRDRIARVLPQWSAQMPGYAQLLGMHAFGLEECGDYARAEDAGRHALALQPADGWAHHAVAHVMEMQGRAEDGIGWMSAREPHWAAEGNFFQVHNWWHRALFHLDLGQYRDVLGIYDARVRGVRSTVALELVDASAMLWRLQLLGQDVGERWQELATTWEQHADGGSYVFNDWHVAMAWLGAGRDRDVERLVGQCRATATGASETAVWTRQIGLPLIEGFIAFWRQDYGAAVERLHAARRIAHGFGGSNAQRDIIDWTLTEAALRGGHRAFGLALARERLALKPYSTVNRGLLARASRAVEARRKAA